MFRFLLGLILGVLLIPAAVYLWFHYGHLPVAVADSPLPQERKITHGALDARIDRELTKTPPIQPDEGNLIAGAQIYHDQCASCHGLHGKPSAFAAHMYPDAPPLWEKHQNDTVVGVSDDPPGETYWKVTNGIRLTGMPSYKDILTDTQRWQVSLLLANADKPLPSTATDLVDGGSPTAPSITAPLPMAPVK